MPKGQPAVRWTAELDGKLLLTIIAVHNIQIDYDVVAKAFGDGIPGSCIQTRMRTLRSKAKGIAGPSSQSSPAAVKPDPATVKSDPATSKSEPATPSKRTREPTSSTPKKRAQKNKGVKHEQSDDETIAAATPPTSSDGQQPPSPIRKESQARISPRNLAKKDYKDITDPFIKLNASHENLFGDSKSGSEDSVGSDEEFEQSANGLETEPLYF